MSLDYRNQKHLIWADELRIKHVFEILLSNAIKYTDDGGRVKITSKESSDQLRITISDTGIGIAAENLPHLFTRFYREDKSRARASGGSGIGLTIARHLVEAHGGQIWAESAGIGQGSQFMFLPPLTQGSPPGRG